MKRDPAEIDVSDAVSLPWWFWPAGWVVFGLFATGVL